MAHPVTELTIGLDLGSATTRLTVLDPSKPMPTVVRNELSNESTSTAVYYGRGEPRCYGENAVSRQITQPAETVTDLVSWLFGNSTAEVHGSTATQANTSAIELRKPRELGGQELYPVQVAAYFIKSMLSLVPQFRSWSAAAEAGERAEASAVTPALRLCMSIPNATAPDSAVALRQACLLAGMPAERTLIAHSDECLAVHFHHVHFKELPVEEADAVEVVLLDVGASCCSGCVIAVSQGKIEKKATSSVEMGSAFLDGALCSYVYGQIAKTHPECDIRGDVKALRKVLRECRKAKEVLSTTDLARVQIEALKGDVDVNVPISKAVLDECATPLITALTLDLLQPLTAVLQGEPRVEIIGGGWRTPCIAQAIKTTLQTTRLGVTLDANLSIAEGSAILGQIAHLAALSRQRTFEGDNTAAEEEAASGTAENAPRQGDAADGVAAMHKVALVNFEVMSPASPVASPLTTDQSAAVDGWREMEDRLSTADRTILDRQKAINGVESYMLQTEAAVGNCPMSEEQKSAARTFLLSVDDYLRDDCEHDAKEKIEEKLREITAHVESQFPEVEAYYGKVREEEARKEAELTKLSQQQREEGGDGEDLKSDPQRLRVAQRRREQGQELFRQEHWQEAQTRFVQALGALGQLYDLENEENKTKKREISLSCHLNIASCSVKLGLWRNAISNCTQALDVDPNNAKALFRRGQAYVSSKDYAAAVKDLELAKTLTNGDAGVVAELERARKCQEAEKAKEKKMFSKMFS